MLLPCLKFFNGFHWHLEINPNATHPRSDMSCSLSTPLNLFLAALHSTALSPTVAFFQALQHVNIFLPQDLCTCYFFQISSSPLYRIVGLLNLSGFKFNVTSSWTHYMIFPSLSKLSF